MGMDGGGIKGGMGWGEGFGAEEGREVGERERDGTEIKELKNEKEKM